MAARLALGTSLLGPVGACGGPSKQAAAGETCFRVADCELGLVCGPDQKCTSDLTSIDIRPDASGGGDVSAGGATGGGPPAGSPDSSSATASGGAAGTTGAGGAGAAGAAGTGSNGSDADAAE